MTFALPAFNYNAFVPENYSHLNDIYIFALHCHLAIPEQAEVDKFEAIIYIKAFYFILIFHYSFSKIKIL